MGAAWWQCSGWLSPVEIDEAADPIGPDPDPNGRRASRKGAVPISLGHHLRLLDWVGRQVRGDKRGETPSGLPPILSRLGLAAKSLLFGLWEVGSPRVSFGLSVSSSPIVSSVGV